MAIPRYDLFISYSREDGERVRPLVEALGELGYRVFFDLESIPVGERWKPRLETAVRHSRALVLCWSARAKASEFVQFEYHKAEGLGKQVLPWLLDGTPLPAMVEIQAITAEDPAQVAAALARRIGVSVTRRRWVAGIAAGTLGLGALGYRWMVLDQTSFSFFGVVTDQDNLPLEGVAVTYSPDIPSAETDKNGRFRLTIKGRQPDFINLTFAKDGYREERVNAATETSTEKPFSFTLRKK